MHLGFTFSCPREPQWHHASNGLVMHIYIVKVLQDQVFWLHM